MENGLKCARLPCLLSALLLLAGPARGWAQSTYGEIRGTVQDASGGILIGATVTATNKGTGEVRTALTDEAGNYSLVNLLAGMYEVAIENSGFRKFVTQNVVLRAREVSRVDARLEVGAAATEVLVTEARQVITTDAPTLVDSKSAEQILALPVNFRAGTTNTVFSTIGLAPGVQPSPGGSEMSLGGSLPFMATSSIDGISSNNMRSNGIITEMFPSADAIDEIKVSTTSNNAEFAQAGDVTTTSKSGTNNLHGAIYWYHQNGALDAKDYFSTRTSAPFKISNDFGFAVGGPIIRNKTFFFGDFEGLRYRAQSQLDITVPPDPWRTGDLSSVSGTISDPLTGQPFAGNIVPSNRISSVSTNILEQLYPRQNVPGNSTASPNHRLQKPGGNENNGFDIRGDHVFNTKQTIFARYTFKNVTTTSPIGLVTLGDAREATKIRALTVAYNYILRQNLINEFRSGFSSRPRLVDFGPDGQPFDGPALVKELGIQGLRPDLPQVASVPDFGITGISGTGRSRGFGQLSRNIQFADNLTWIKGRHTFKFGADIRRVRYTDNVSFFSGDDLGEYRFDGRFSGQPFADFLLGYPNRTRLANTGPDVNPSTYHHGYFVQDDWKLGSRFTLSYGVRYEYHPPFWDESLQIANFDRDFPGGRVIVPNQESLALTAPGFRASIGNTPIVTADEAGWPKALRWSDKNNFSPRFGFAWRPFADNRTVVRGGYGTYTVTIVGAVSYSLVGIHTSDTRTFDNTLVDGRPQLAFPNPFLSGLGTIGSIGTQDFRRGNDPRGPDPYAQQWNLTVERDLGWNTGLRVTYTGSHTIRLFSSPDLNQIGPNTVGYATARALKPFPNWNIVYSRDPIGSAKYHSLQIEGQKRFSQGLYFQSSWVWSKNLTDTGGSASSAFAGEAGSVPTNRFDLAMDYAEVSPSRRHRWLTTFVYELPFGFASADTTARRVANGVVKGWQFSGILLLQTGQFLSPVTSGATDPSGTNVSSRASDRPDWAPGYTGDGNLSSGRSIAAWFDRNAFVVPPALAGRFGYVGPGLLVGPGTQVFSAKLQKRFHLHEQTYFQIEGSAANLFNHPNFGNPATNISAANFGRITTTQTVEGAGARQLQVGLRIVF
jgi:hypothetical protein